MIRICNLWSTANVQWQNSNWTWDDCLLVRDICAVWGETDVLWKNANWKWSECTSSAAPPTDILALRLGVDATTLIQPWMQEETWTAYRTSSLDKRKRLIKLICKVKGQKYDEEKEIKDFKVTIGDIRMVVKAVSNIDLDLKLEE